MAILMTETETNNILFEIYWFKRDVKDYIRDNYPDMSSEELDKMLSYLKDQWENDIDHGRGISEILDKEATDWVRHQCGAYHKR